MQCERRWRGQAPGEAVEGCVLSVRGSEHAADKGRESDAAAISAQADSAQGVDEVPRQPSEPTTHVLTYVDKVVRLHTNNSSPNVHIPQVLCVASLRVSYYLD